MKINKLIYPLEPRVMLDGAAAVDVIDNVDDILQIKKIQTTDSIKFIEQTKETSLPFINIERDQRDQKNKNMIIFCKVSSICRCQSTERYNNNNINHLL